MYIMLKWGVIVFYVATYYRNKDQEVVETRRVLKPSINQVS
jgi:hypothetical protein